MSLKPATPPIKIRQYTIEQITVNFVWDPVDRDMRITINNPQNSIRMKQAYEGDVLHALNEAIYLYTKEIA